MKYLVLFSTIFLATVSGRVRDRDNGELKLNDECSSDMIMKQKRCSVGLDCDEKKGKCKMTEDETCKINDDCLTGLSCKNGVCCAVTVTTMTKKTTSAKAKPTEASGYGDAEPVKKKLGESCAAKADCVSGLVCSSGKKCAKPPPKEVPCDGKLGSRCSEYEPCNEGLVCLANKKCGKKPVEIY